MMDFQLNMTAWTSDLHLSTHFDKILYEQKSHPKLLVKKQLTFLPEIQIFIKIIFIYDYIKKW